MVDKLKFFQVGGFPQKFKNSTDYWSFLKIAQKFDIDSMDKVCCKCRDGRCECQYCGQNQNENSCNCDNKQPTDDVWENLKQFV